MIRWEMRNLLETRRVFAAIVVVGLLAMCLRPMTDPDVWWHLRTGQLTLQNHAVFHQDPYSATVAGHQWINHEWLFDVLLFAAYQILGKSGLMVFFAGIICGAFLLAYARSPGKPYIAGLVTIGAATASIPTFGVRPQMLSLLLTSAFLCILDMRKNRTRFLWTLVPIMLLWVNVHAGFAIGPALILLVLTGEFLDVALRQEVWQSARKRIGTLVLVFFASLAVAALNPNGIRLYAYPWQTLVSHSMQTYIHEWFSPNFHQAEYVPLLLLILITLVAVNVSKHRPFPSEFLLIGATLFAALRSVRHIPIFALVTIPFLSAILEGLPQLAGASFGQRSRTPPGLSKRMANALILASLGAFAFVRFQTVLRSQPREEALKFPAGATSWIQAHHPPGPILNDYDWGGYLIWKIYPEYRVFIDGRADLYADSFMDEMAHVYYLKDGWKHNFESWHVRTVLLPPDAPLTTLLASEKGWRVAYKDGQAVVLISESPNSMSKGTVSDNGGTLAFPGI